MVNHTLWLAALVSLAAVGNATPLQARQAPLATTSARPTTTTTATATATTTVTTTSAITSPPGTATTTTAGGAPTAASTLSPSQIKALQQDLILAPSEVDKYNILLPNPPDASGITFQFVNNSVKYPTGGTIALAQVDNFPALLLGGVAMAIGFVNPCGLNVPHSHPRSDEFLTVVQGTLVAGLVLESEAGAAGNLNGTNPTGSAPLVNTTLTNYKGILFPKGNVHFQFNPTCQPAVFAAAFDNIDPGRAQLAADFFAVQPDDVTLSAVGGDTTLLNPGQIDSLRGKIPTAFAEIIDSCAKRCGIPTS